MFVPRSNVEENELIIFHAFSAMHVFVWALPRAFLFLYFQGHLWPWYWQQNGYFLCL